MAADSRGHRGRGLAAVVFCVLWAAMSAPLHHRPACRRLRGRPGFAACATSGSRARHRQRRRSPPFMTTLDGSVELRHDQNAGFWSDKRGFLGGRRVWFAGTGCPPRRLRPDVYLRLRAWRDQGDLPVFVARARERQWWWWRDAFYWESGDFEPEDIRSATWSCWSATTSRGSSWSSASHRGGAYPGRGEAFRVRTRPGQMPGLRFRGAHPVRPRRPVVDGWRQRARERQAALRRMQPSPATTAGAGSPRLKQFVASVKPVVAGRASKVWARVGRSLCGS